MQQTLVRFLAVANFLFSAALFPSTAVGQEKPTQPSSRKRPPIVYSTSRVVAYQLRRLTNQQLVLLPRDTVDLKYVPVYEAFLSRPGLEQSYRKEAIGALAKLNNSKQVAELIAAIQRLDQDEDGDGSVLHELVIELTNFAPEKLRTHRTALEKLAHVARRVVARRAALAAMVIANATWDTVWEYVEFQEKGLVDLISTLPMIPNLELRNAFYPKVESLIHQEQESEIRNAAIHGISHVPGYQRQAFALLCQLIQRDEGREAAIISIRRIAESAWNPELIGPLVDSLLTYAKSIPVAERDSGIFLETIALGLDLVEKLPKDQAPSTRKEFRSLTVPVFLIKTVTHQMLYDRSKMVVEAGKQVSVLLVNEDLMPHNLVIVSPGAHEEVGLAAEAFAAMMDARAKDYLPDSSKILWATKLLQPGQKEKLSFTAPKAPGVYPYVCTYPGHWRRMFGAMYVVADLESYHANPKDYLQQHPLQVLDELLKRSRPRTQWTLEQLESSLLRLSKGRSFERAQGAFQTANCIACHRLNGVGNEFGPDLTKLDQKLQPSDILGEILEPSKKINEKFYTYTFVLESGRSVTGLIVGESTEGFQVIEDPLARSKPTELRKSAIETQQKSAVSIMPRGLLDTMTEEEVLDLVAYLVARGNRQSKLFRGGHVH